MQTTLALLGLLLASFSSSSALAQEAGGVSQPEYKLRVDARLATADVSVVAKRAKVPLLGLSAKDFAVFDNGREQPITHFNVVGEDTRPLAVVILLDLWWGYKNNVVQGGDQHVLERLPDAVRRVVAGLRPDDRIAIVTWDIVGEACTPSVKWELDFSRDPDLVAARFGELIAHHPRDKEHPRDCAIGSSKLGAEAKRHAQESYPLAQDGAIAMAGTKLVGLPEMRREIIAFDHDYSSEAREKTRQMVEDLDREQVTFNLIKDPLWLVAFANAIVYAQGGFLKNEQQRVLHFYAEQTGGASLAPSSNDYVGALEALLLSLRSSYSLAWRAPEADGQFHKLRVEVRSHKDADVRTRREYFAPKTNE